MPRSAFDRTGEIPESDQSKKTQKYYVIWHGHQPGIYTTWPEAQKQIVGFKKPVYKIFGSEQLAKKAFDDSPENYQGDYKKTKDLTPEELEKIGQPEVVSLCVDAACNNKGDFEYKGVWNHNLEEVFIAGPYPGGSNNIGEFLALVHALAFLSNFKDKAMHKLPIYSDSRIAMGWVKAKTCRTKQTPSPAVKNLILRAEKVVKNPYL